MNPGPRARRASPSVALMYHALGDGVTPDGQDPHYTLDVALFERHMARIAAGPGGRSVASFLRGGDGGNVLVTFDDGHASNYTHAFPILQRHGLTADFFINPGSVGSHGFAGWGEWRRMADAGMSVQSHGYDHVYLTQLEPRRLRETLSAAREEIAQRIGHPVTLLAPPGGRMPADLHAIAQECGYTHVVSSQPGVIAHSASPFRPLPRMAVTAKTGTAFERWISGDGAAIRRERIRYAGLSLAKRMLGDQRYERVRAQALASLRGNP